MGEVCLLNLELIDLAGNHFQTTNMSQQDTFKDGDIYIITKLAYYETEVAQKWPQNQSGLCVLDVKFDNKHSEGEIYIVCKVAETSDNKPIPKFVIEPYIDTELFAWQKGSEDEFFDEGVGQNVSPEISTKRKMNHETGPTRVAPEEESYVEEEELSEEEFVGNISYIKMSHLSLYFFP